MKKLSVITGFFLLMLSSFVNVSQNDIIAGDSQKQWSITTVLLNEYPFVEYDCLFGGTYTFKTDGTYTRIDKCSDDSTSVMTQGVYEFGDSIMSIDEVDFKIVHLNNKYIRLKKDMIVDIYNQNDEVIDSLTHKSAWEMILEN